MRSCKSAKVVDSGEALVDERGALRDRDSDSTIVEETRQVPCVAPDPPERPGYRASEQVCRAFEQNVGPSRPTITAKSKRKTADTMYEYDKDGLVMGSPHLDRVVDLYVEQKPEWGIDDASPPLSFKERVSKFFTSARVWEADMVQRENTWRLQWQTQIVQEDRKHGNRLAVKALKQAEMDEAREEGELCQRYEDHDAKLRNIMDVEAPKFWEQLGLYAV